MKTKAKYSKVAIAELAEIGLPDPVEMIDRIVAAFELTWETIAGDWHDVLETIGDRDSKRKLKRMTGRDVYEACVDYLSRYHDDPDAFAAWELWSEMGFRSGGPDRAEATMVKALNGCGW